VRLQLTVRSYADAVRQQIHDAIRRIVRGQAVAFGIPEALLPEVKLQDEFTPATYNNPELTERLRKVFVAWLGEANVVRKKPVMGGEDFGEFGRTSDKIPICLFTLGGVVPEVLKESKQAGKPLPSLHSPLWAPSPEPSLKTGVTAMTAVVLDLMEKK
jgi:metal-dependent amidase/aminoacylase/carboxypeptidase family protein